jgi:predicted lipoprotein with Yx(FWY)xxD motif
VGPDHVRRQALNFEFDHSLLEKDSEMRLSRAQNDLIRHVLFLSGVGIIVLACGSNKGKLPSSDDDGGSHSGGTQNESPSDGGTGGSTENGGNPNGGTSAAGSPDQGGEAMGGGAGAAGAGGQGGWDPPPGVGGEGGTTTVQPMGGTGNGPSASCVYSTEGSEAPPEEPETGGTNAGGEGGGGPRPTVTVLKNAFVGTYLADENGKALYAYGRDLPGDCENVPITNCFEDCAVSWPIFDAAPRLVAEGLDDSLFGRIERMDKQEDGTYKLNYHTTYRGWPLYYYKSDLLPGDVKGQGKGSIWHLAEVVLPNMVIIRMGSGETEKRTLADEFGHTLYVSSEDSVGTATTDPVSTCTGSCLDDFRPFMLRYLSPVSYIDPANLSVFVRSDGSQQLAYKGAPLYYSPLDLRSGDMNGLAIAGFTWAAP